MNKKVIPLGVKVIAILYFMSSFMVMTVPWVGLQGASSETISVYLPLLLLFGYGIFGLFLAVGLLKGQKWSRIVAIFLSILDVTLFIINYIGVLFLGRAPEIIGRLYNLIIIKYLFLILTYPLVGFGIGIFVSLAINLGIGVYLIFSRNVKSAFSS